MAEIFELESLGFLRVAVVSPELRVADVAFNLGRLDEALQAAAQQGCRLAVFPELCLTGYSCADLFYQALLLEKARAGLLQVAAASERAGVAAVVGLPLEIDGRLYNCAALVSGGRVVGIVPKSFLPSTNEYYEDRWFTSGRQCQAQTLTLGGTAVPFGRDLLFPVSAMPDCVLGLEICEDLWAVVPPSSDLALAGATLLVNPSASNELLGKADYRRDLVKQQSARCLAAYLYAGASAGESSTDLVFAGHSLIAENGVLLAETQRFQLTTQMAVADVDLQRLKHERVKNSSFADAAPARAYRRIPFDLAPEVVQRPLALKRPVSATPFVPADLNQRARHCREIFDLQSTGLARRLKHTGSRQVTLGLSGGLDSTLALLVTIKAFDVLGLPHAGLVAVTMPGFGTTARTQTNAETLAQRLGVTLRQIPIREAVRLHFADIGHLESVHDVTYENAQARERTQILMDIANQIGGLMVGTGDLSELALGWCTYNADHMSMYHVNAGVPKTLVRYLVEWCADAEFSGEVSQVLRDICATPITPELLPLGEGDTLEQKTEATIGPYVLHDFFLFYTVRHLFPPRKVFWLARQAFGDVYAPEEIVRWLRLFYRRFFSQQFKRSAMPDGPKVGSVALSPRGDWRMPSDASGDLWLAEVDALEADALAGLDGQASPNARGSQRPARKPGG
jgi:NAD+ synthase (glutamine-hydrolysing)